jgi:hypothetical protein
VASISARGTSKRSPASIPDWIIALIDNCVYNTMGDNVANHMNEKTALTTVILWFYNTIDRLL